MENKKEKKGHYILNTKWFLILFFVVLIPNSELTHDFSYIIYSISHKVYANNSGYVTKEIFILKT